MNSKKLYFQKDINFSIYGLGSTGLSVVKTLRKFKAKNFKRVFIETLYSNDNVHPFLRGIVGFYIREINYRKGYLINIDHSEATSCNLDKVYELIGGFKEIFAQHI